MPVIPNQCLDVHPFSSLFLKKLNHKLDTLLMFYKVSFYLNLSIYLLLYFTHILSRMSELLSALYFFEKNILKYSLVDV